MNRIIPIALLLASLVFTASADFRRLLLAGRVSASCATTDTTVPHDVLLEGWQTGAGENTWTNIGDSAKMNIIDTTAYTSGKPAGACDKAFVLTNGTDGVEAFKLWDNGSAIVTSSTALDVVFSLYVETSPGNNDAFIFLTANNNVSTTTASPVFDAALYNNAGTLQIGIGGTAATALYTNVTAGTWNTIKIHIDTTAANSYWQLNGGSTIGFTNANTSARYFRQGAVSALDANDTGTVIHDLLHIDTP